ncbi:MAG: hypothetical protein EOO89_09200 [Pedobacter sp.]|nr:MAG: hypothetical protein EOO89_09200 [Pedobacter sp.]
MRRPALYLIIVIASFGCRTTTGKESETIRMIQLQTLSFGTVSDTVIVPFVTNNRIVYYKDLQLYITRTLRSMEIGDTDKYVYDTLFHYHVIKQGDDLGLQYDSLNIKIPKKFRIDSLLKENQMDAEYLRIFDFVYSNPFEVTRNKFGELVNEKYAFAKKNGKPDSIFRYYDLKLKGIDFSYSRKIDSLKKSKLVKTIFLEGVVPLRRSAGYKLSFEMSEVPIKDPKFYIDLFKRYTRDIEGISKREAIHPIRMKHF